MSKKELYLMEYCAIIIGIISWLHLSFFVYNNLYSDISMLISFGIFLSLGLLIFLFYTKLKNKKTKIRRKTKKILLIEILLFLISFAAYSIFDLYLYFDKVYAFLFSLIIFIIINWLLVYQDNEKNKNKPVVKDINRNEKVINKIFISHSRKDKKYSDAMFKLLTEIGVPDSQIFYSTMAENGIPLHENIYDYLLKQFKDYNLHVIFMLSENYYKSIFCLQEMGAAWVLKHKTDTVLLPTFTEDKIKGSINPNEINIKLDSEDFDLKVRLEQFKDEISEEFEIEKITSIKWERVRDEFIEKVKQISAAK